jgi:hypothetical protein
MRGDAETRKLGLTVDGAHKNIRRLDVFMYEAAPANLSKRRGHSNGERQEALQRHRPSDQPLERFAVGVLAEERKPPLTKLQPQRAGKPTQDRAPLATNTRVAAASRFRVKAASRRAWWRGEGTARHPTRHGAGRVLRPPTESQAHVRTQPSRRGPLLIRLLLAKRPQRRSAADVPRTLNQMLLRQISRPRRTLAQAHQLALGGWQPHIKAVRWRASVPRFSSAHYGRARSRLVRTTTARGC